MLVLQKNSSPISHGKYSCFYLIHALNIGISIILEQAASRPGIFNILSIIKLLLTIINHFSFHNKVCNASVPL